MVQLSARARRELAIMHVADAMRVLAACAVPLLVLPFGGLLVSVLSMSFEWGGFFLAWSVAQVVLHLTLLHAADHLLEESRRNLLLALSAGTLLLLLTIAGQVIVAGVLGFFLVVLLTCGLFDVLACGALLYVFWATYKSIYARTEPGDDRHTGFEVVLPEATRADDRSSASG